MRLYIVLIGFLLTGIATANTAKNPSVGAVGWLEPEDGIIAVGHDGGMEGVKIDSILVDVGERVVKGQKIAYFSDFKRRSARLNIEASRKLVLLEQHSRLESKLEYLKDKLNRSKKLVRNNMISEMDFEKFEFDVRNSQHELSEMEAQIQLHESVLHQAKLELQRSYLTAPITGTVLSIDVRVGQRVNTGPIVSLANLDRFVAVVEVSEGNVLALKDGQQARVLAPEIDREFDGYIVNINRYINTTKMVPTDPVSLRDRRVVEVRVKIFAPADKLLGRMINHKVRVVFQ